MGKRTLSLILALLPCFLFTPVKASTDIPTEGRPINIDRAGHVHPRSIEPECYYLDGYVYITCDSTVTSIDGTVTRLSDNLQWSDSSTSYTLQIAVPTDAGTYHLEFSLSDGSYYYGDYIL